MRRIVAVLLAGDGALIKAAFSKIRLVICSVAALLTCVAPSMAAPAPDACKVFKPADANPFLKQPATKTERPAAGNGCRFETADGSYLEFHTSSGESVDFAYNLGATGGPKATLPLAGVGDKAKMAERGNGVVVVKGQLSCGVSGGGVSWKFANEPAEEKAQAQRLAALCIRYFAAG